MGEEWGSFSRFGGWGRAIVQNVLGRLQPVLGNVHLRQSEPAVGYAVQLGDRFGYNVDGDALGFQPTLNEDRLQSIGGFAQQLPFGVGKVRHVRSFYPKEPTPLLMGGDGGLPLRPLPG